MLANAALQRRDDLHGLDLDAPGRPVRKFMQLGPRISPNSADDTPTALQKLLDHCVTKPARRTNDPKSVN
jgi:hypothetical protein